MVIGLKYLEQNQIINGNFTFIDLELYFLCVIW